MADVFISYSRRDADFVAKLAAALNTAGRDVWVDVDGIRASEEWKEKIFREIDGANTFLFVISPDAIQSEIAHEEISHAALNSKRMIPLFYRSVEEKKIPEALSRFQGIVFSDDGRFPAGVSELLRTLETDLEWVEAHTRLLTRAKEWEREGKERSFLLRGKDLGEAEQMVAKSADREPKLTALQSEYILASRQTATKTQRLIIGAVTVAALVALVLAGYALLERNAANTSAVEARQQRDTAVKNEEKANQQEAIARTNGERATRQQKIAEEQTVIAKRQKALAEKNAVEAKEQQGIAEENARQSKARELAALSMKGLNENPETSILLAAGAVNSTFPIPLPDAEEALHRAIWSSLVRQTLRSEEGVVCCVAFSPDGGRLATGGSDGTVKVWNAVTGEKIRELQARVGTIRGVAFGPKDGRLLAAIGRSNQIEVWDGRSGDERRVIRLHSSGYYGLAFSPDGTRLAAANASGVEVWNVVSGKDELNVRFSGGAPGGVAFSPDGKRLATTGKVTVWDAFEGQALLALRGHASAVVAVTFSPDGKQLATASKDKTATVWDAVTGRELLTLRSQGHSAIGSGSITGVAFSPDGRRLATSCDDGTATIWDLANGQEWLTMRGHLQSITAVAFSPDGKRLATASEDGTARVWATSEEEDESLALSGLDDHNTEAPATALAFSPDGGRIATGTLRGDTKVWNMGSGMELLNLRNPEAHVSGMAEVAVMVFSPDGKRIAAVTKGETAKEAVAVWDARDGRPLLTLHPDGGRIAGIVFTARRDYLVVASCDGTVTNWDVESGQNMQWRPDQVGSIAGWASIPEAAFSANGKQLAVAETDKALKILETGSKRELTRFESGSSRPIPSFPQGTFQGFEDLPSAFSAVAFSPDGLRVAIGYDDGKIELREARGGSSLMLVGHKSKVNALVFSRDGSSRLASAGDDGTVKLWGMSSAQELLTLPGFSDSVWSLAFSPKGKYLAAAYSNGTVQIYAMDINDLLKLARSRVTRDLTPEECQRYFQSKTCPKMP
jgi:WD40 repeat protein